ncbi:Glutathione S-transferase GstA [Leminorella richardii]|uniref:Glutathione S-transferase GstA n=1 Tax=Leminorella richardii TaxID=158841 RepID=A0A2X4U655_9GAMM|nr:glutathione S-transferase family protein [Leminorella richardii]SQI34109.1 Glutathione S-transferase GstA [Leminorella richardii]
MENSSLENSSLENSILIYAYPYSRSTRALWTAQELGLDYDVRFIDVKSKSRLTENGDCPHPLVKVPALIDNSVQLFESVAICKYLAENYGGDWLYPTEKKARAETDMWLSYAITDLEQPLWTMLKHTMLLPEALRVPAIVPVARAEFEHALRALPETLTPVGQAFTLADIFISHVLSWAKGLSIALSSPHEEYIKRCQSRPAFLQVRKQEAEAAERMKNEARGA